MERKKKVLVVGAVCVIVLAVAGFATDAVWGWVPHAPKYGPRIGGPAVTAPVGAAYTFAYMGDTRGNVAVLDKELRAQVASGAAFCIYGGDLVDKCTNSGFEQFYQTACEATGGKLAMYLIVGNHDLRRFFTSYSITAYRNFFGPENYSFWYGPDAFVIVNDNEASDGFSEAVATEVEKMIASIRPKARNIFLACHVPPVDPRGGTHCLPPEDGKRLLALAKQYRVAAILASHIHGYSDLQPEGVRLIISGGAGARLGAGAKLHWVQVTVEGTQVTFKPVDVTGVSALPPRGKEDY